MKKTGKPAFQPSAVQRNTVMLLIASGMSEAAIASAIAVNRRTLAKYFSDELLNGHSCKRAENLLRLEKAARSGNVTAMKHLDAVMSLTPENAPRPEPLGKKAALDQEAQTGHEKTSWGDLLQ